MNIITEFFDVMIDHGFQPGRVVCDGKYHRFDIDKKGNKAGYYNLAEDGFGVFGDWRTGQQFKFRNKKAECLTPQEREEIAARLRESRRKEEEDRKQRQSSAAAKAYEIYSTAAPAPADHPYLARKNVSPHFAKVGLDGRLIVPLYDGEKIASVQFIAANGDKLFLFNGKKAGCYATIKGSTAVVFVVEGFATGATVHAATGCETIIAFDAGNVESCATNVRRIYGEATPICFAADNDHKGEKNAGIESATAAAESVGGFVKYPEGITGTDWNDAAAERGLDYVKLCLMPEIPVPAVMPEAVIITERALDLEVDANGKPKCTKENLAAVCKANGIALRYNIIAKREEILVPGSEYSVDNSEVSSYAHVLSEVKREGMSTAHVREYLTNLCDQNQFNPVAAWILSKPWDGVDRLPQFYASIEQENDADNYQLKEIKLKRWMIGAVAAALSPQRISTRGVLVFQGAQGLGKTQWFKKLVPPALDLVKDGYILRLDDKDNIYQCLSNWLIELGELDATFKKSDIAQLKAFLTSDRDVLRLPYAAKKSTFLRRTVFFASVNQREFLHDETGNSRFWVIPCQRINYNHGLDMQQGWAQFHNMWRDGEAFYMSPEEMAQINAENRDFESIDSVYERVSRHFDWDSYTPAAYEWYEDSWKTATEVAKIIGIVNPTNAEVKKASEAVKKLNGGMAKRRNGNVENPNRDRVVLVPRPR